MLLPVFVTSSDELENPRFTMGLISKLRAWSHELTPYFIYLLFVATLGPLLFGYHLVGLPFVGKMM